MSPTPSDDLPVIAALFSRPGRVLVTTHVNPDGDAIGSELALARLLAARGAEVVMVNQDPVPANLRFLPGAELVLPPPPVGAFDAVFLVDCGHPDRAGSVLGALDPTPRMTVNIDHHATGHPWADLNLIDPTASSTAEIVHRLIVAVVGQPDPGMALCVYTGLAADTGTFRYGNTTPAVLRLAADLVEAGVEPSPVAVRLYESVPYPTLRLLGRALQGLCLSDDGSVAWMCVRPSDLAATGTSWEDTEEFVNHPRSIPGVQVAILFKERGDGTVKVSFRSRGTLDVARIAVAHGGGGHVNAAGCTLAGTIDGVRDMIVAEASAAVAANPGSLPTTERG